MFLNLTRHYAQKYRTLLLAAICSILFFVTSYVYVQLFANPPSGDEPHFLVISQTLLKYHSLNVMLDYQHGDYHLFYQIALAPHVAYSASGQLLPLHSIGAPILWLIPYSFLVSFAYAVASPLYIYSHLTFIEPIRAFICIYVVRKIFQDEIKVSDLLISSVLLGILPWVHIRFAFFEMVLFFALLYKIYTQNKGKDLKYYLYSILPVTILFIIFEIYNYKVWGSLNPTINEVNDIHGGSKPFVVAPFNGILGVFFDQEFGLFVTFPIFILLIPGIVLAT